MTCRPPGSRCSREAWELGRRACEQQASEKGGRRPVGPPRVRAGSTSTTVGWGGSQALRAQSCEELCGPRGFPRNLERRPVLLGPAPHSPRKRGQSPRERGAGPARLRRRHTGACAQGFRLHAVAEASSRRGGDGSRPKREGHSVPEKEAKGPGARPGPREPPAPRPAGPADAPKVQEGLLLRQP